MKASMSALIVVLTITSLGLMTNSASACGRGRGGYGGGYYGGYRSYDQPVVYVKKIYVQPVQFSPTVVQPVPIAMAAPIPMGLPPAFGNPPSNFIPQGAQPAGPFDPWANMIPPGPGFAPQANAFPQMNGASPQGANFVSQGSMMNPQIFNAASPGAPNGEPNAFQGNRPVMPNVTQPNVEAPTAAAPSFNIRVVAAEEQLPSVAIGSIVMLDGPSLGNERGTVRLTIDGLSLPVEVLEWNATAIKIQLPLLDVTSARKAEIEVLRSHGGLASKRVVELTPATSRLTLGN